MASGLAIDVGTSSVRAVVFGDDGEQLASARTENPDPSGLSFDPEALWDRVAACIRMLEPSRRRDVRTITIAAHIGTVFVDALLRPVTQGRGWADQSGLARLDELFSDDEERVRRVIRRPRLTGGALAASLALRADSPDADALVSAVLSPKDYLNARLTGVLATDPVSAAYTGASDVAERTWSRELLEAAELDASRFPPQRAGDTVLGTILAPIARDVGLSTDVVVVVGAPDGTAGATYLLAAFPHDIADIAGTTDMLARRVRELPDDGRCVVNPSLVGADWTVGGPTGLTGGAVAHWRRRWQVAVDVDDRDWRHALEVLPPGAEGLRAGTSLTGSRFPAWRAGERGWFVGWAEHHQRPHLIRAVVEGAAYAVREGLDVLDPSGTTAVVLAGGNARSALVAQLRADIANRVVRVSAEADATIRGAALLGFSAVGVAFSASVEVMEYEPRAERSRAYQSLYDVWRADRGDLSG